MHLGYKIFSIIKWKGFWFGNTVQRGEKNKTPLKWNLSQNNQTIKGLFLFLKRKIYSCLSAINPKWMNPSGLTSLDNKSAMLKKNPK